MAAIARSPSPSRDDSLPGTNDTVDLREMTGDSMEASQIGTQDPQDSYRKIAQAVAAILTPTITSAVDRAEPMKEIGEHSQRLTEAEQRISSLEDEQYQTNAAIEKYTQAQELLHEKIEDLENRSRRNNLRISGLQEIYKPGSLLNICAN